MMKIENRMINRNCIFIGILFTCLLMACSKEESTENNKMPISLSFQPLAYGAAIDTSKTYVNNSGESFKISKFKYYVSSIEFVNSTGVIKDSSYHLIDLYDSSSQTFSINLEKGIYDTVRFSIGVDSTHNVSGAQSGDLDPMLGMFWTWNTGYIYVKLEGKSPVSTAPNQQFTYHIGGFKTGENALRKISFPILFDVDKHAGIQFSADVSNWFDGPNTLKISVSPAIMTPGSMAMKFADNYARMFSVVKIVNR